MLLRSLARRGGDLFAKNKLSSGVPLYSLPGPFRTYALRQRYPVLFRQCTDPVITDVLFGKSVKSWCADVPHYNYWFCSAMAFTASCLFILRHVYFNPDFMYRREDKRHHMQDRHRLHTYALPYYNHQLRNICTRYTWMFVDNEHDWVHSCPSGVRPHRGHSLRRPLFPTIFSYHNYLYPMHDPMMSTTSHENMCQIYHDIGYKKIDGYVEEEDDD